MVTADHGTLFNEVLAVLRADPAVTSGMTFGHCANLVVVADET